MFVYVNVRSALWEEAEHERNRLELIISSMAEGLLITNVDGVITSLNSSAQHLFSLAEVDLQQKPHTSLRQLAWPLQGSIGFWTLQKL